MRAQTIFADERASAGEFALILPLFLAILFGIIDGGRYFWAINQAEKATQAGARAAVVTGMIPSGLIDHSFSVDNGVPQGQPVPVADFPGVTCTGTASGASCTWLEAPAEDIELSPDGTSFGIIVARMQDFMPSLAPENVTVAYTNSGLGFAGDPQGPDIAPIITVSLNNATFEPILTSVFGVSWDIPASPYSLSQEDGIGRCFEEDIGC